MWLQSVYLFQTQAIKNKQESLLVVYDVNKKLVSIHRFLDNISIHTHANTQKYVIRLYSTATVVS